MTLKRILLDLDDVLNTFTPYIMNLLGCGCSPCGYGAIPPCAGYDLVRTVNYSHPSRHNWTSNEVWGRVTREVWATVPCTPHGKLLIQKASSLVGEENVYIVSRPTSDPDSLAGKLEWIHAHLPPVFSSQFLLGAPKHICAAPGIVLIDDNPDNDLKSVETEYKRLNNSVFKHRRIGLLHGKLKSTEKEKIMRQFMLGQLDILVSTTVVEVGVDVPNATVMLIENADNFGLSQLHQLRGRVGRSSHQSYCYLVMSSSKKPSQRLRAIERSNNGFYLAEEDLRLRGPGEIYGRMQHGKLNLQIATLADTKMIARAQKWAQWFMKNNQSLLQYENLAENVKQYQKITTLN